MAVDAKAVVLCCDEGLAGHHVQHRLVLASGKQREEKINHSSFLVETIKSYGRLMVCPGGLFKVMWCNFVSPANDLYIFEIRTDF